MAKLFALLVAYIGVPLLLVGLWNPALLFSLDLGIVAFFLIAVAGFFSLCFTSCPACIHQA